MEALKMLRFFIFWSVKKRPIPLLYIWLEFSTLLLMIFLSIAIVITKLTFSKSIKVWFLKMTVLRVLRTYLANQIFVIPYEVFTV